MRIIIGRNIDRVCAPPSIHPVVIDMRIDPAVIEVSPLPEPGAAGKFAFAEAAVSVTDSANWVPEGIPAYILDVVNTSC